MKLRSLQFILFSLICVSAWAGQDLLMKARFDIESSQAFINSLRSFLIQNSFGDPYQQNFENDITIDLSRALEEVPQDTQNWIRELQSILKVRVFDSEYKMIIKGLNYSVQDFNTEILPVFIDSNAKAYVSDRIQYVTHNYVKGMRIGTSDIVFETRLKTNSGADPLVLTVELKNAEFRISPELLMELPMGWFTAVAEDRIELNLHSVNLKKIFDEINKKPELIQFSLDDLVIPRISIRVGHREVTLDAKKLKQFFYNRQNDLKLGILDILNTRYTSMLTNILGNNPQNLYLPRTLKVDTSIGAMASAGPMSVNRARIIEMNLSGQFCEKGFLPSIEDCFSRQITSKLRRVIPAESFQRSSRLINRLLIEKSANIALSASEEYINNLVSAAIKSGMMEKSLEEKGIKLGPETAFVLADEAGDTFSLFLDVVNTLKGMQRVMVGRSEIRFPVKLKIAIQIMIKEGTPHFIIRVKEMATDHNLLLNGLPQYGLESGVRLVPRFRQQVMNKILDELSGFNKSVLIDIPVPEFKGTFFEQVLFSSDGLGRANATINFNKKRSEKIQ